MDDHEIKTNLDFNRYVQRLLHERNDVDARSLEEYLRTLYGQLENFRDQQPTWALFAQLIELSFTQPIPTFDPEWLQIKRYPKDEAYEGRECDYVLDFLRYQISDLRLMRDAGTYEQSDGRLWLGNRSPRGSTWYQFFVIDFLAIAAQGWGEIECSWLRLADFLADGQVSE